MVGIEEALGSDPKPNRRETMGELAWMESMMGWLMAVGLGRSLKVKQQMTALGGIKDVLALGYSVGVGDGTAHG